MPRRLRCAGGGYACHVLNWAVARERIFAKNGDCKAFEEVLVEAKEQAPMRVLAWCVMPAHWRLGLWSREDGDLSEFLRWMTVTHTQRWHAAHRIAGTGPLYQGRFKSFPVQVRGGRVGGAAVFDSARQTVWRRGMARKHGEASGPGVHAACSWSAAKIARHSKSLCKTPDPCAPRCLTLLLRQHRLRAVRASFPPSPGAFR